MLIDVLPVAGTEFQAADELDELGMQPENALFKYGGFARLFDLLVDFLGDPLHRFLDAGGMNAAVRDQPLQR